MEQRKLGNSGLEVSRLCLGTNVFGWTADEAISWRLLDAFVAAGLNFLDTADTYSTWVPGHQGGESETIIGHWLKRSGKRAQVILATKVGKEMGPRKAGLSRAYILEEVEASLRRLHTDYIDLYQSHADDLQTPLEETLSAFAQLIKAGKVRAIGASNYSAERLEQALQVSREHNWPRFESLQPHYNLVEREAYEKKLEPVCVRHHLGVISYFSLASGFLTGKYRSQSDLAKSARGAAAGKYLNERGLRILHALDQVAEQYQASVASVALAWLMARPSITAPIASATSLEQLQTLVAATQLRLDRQAIDMLDRASA